MKIQNNNTNLTARCLDCNHVAIYKGCPCDWKCPICKSTKLHKINSGKQ